MIRYTIKKTDRPDTCAQCGRAITKGQEMILVTDYTVTPTTYHYKACAVSALGVERLKRVVSMLDPSKKRLVSCHFCGTRFKQSLGACPKCGATIEQQRSLVREMRGENENAQ